MGILLFSINFYNYWYIFISLDIFWYVGIFAIFISYGNFVSLVFRLVYITNYFYICKSDANCIFNFSQIGIKSFLTNILGELFPDLIKIFVYVWIVWSKTKYVRISFLLVYCLYYKIVVMKIFKRKVSVPSMSKIVSHS